MSTLNSIALMASHYDTNTTPDYVENLVRQLSTSFDQVILLVSSPTLPSPSPNLHNVKIVKCVNQGLDFGKWKTAVTDIVDFDNIDRVLIVNDSFTITRPDGIKYVLEQASAKGLSDFWGITNSYEVCHHIQSYFMMFSGPRAIKVMRSFFASITPDTLSQREKIIARCEIGLSIYMHRNGFPVQVVYDYDTLFVKYLSHIVLDSCNLQNRVPPNPSYSLYQCLLAEECPLIKRKRYDSA